MSSRLVSLPDGPAINIKQPYAEGHVCTALEADKLNSAMVDSIRTTLINKLKKAKEAGVDPDSLAGEFQSYADSYVFSARVARTPSDPVEKEAHKLAREHVYAAIRNKGGNPADYSTEQVSSYIAKVLELRPDIREEAKRRIESSRVIATDSLADIFESEEAA